MIKMKIKMMKIKVKISMMMMKKVSDDDGYLVMKVILWWNLSKYESYLVMKVMIVKEVMTGDVSPVAMFCICVCVYLCIFVFVYVCICVFCILYLYLCIWKVAASVCKRRLNMCRRSKLKLSRCIDHPVMRMMTILLLLAALHQLGDFSNVANFFQIFKRG